MSTAAPDSPATRRPRPGASRPEPRRGPRPASSPRPLGELLLEARLITSEELEAALEKQSKSKLRLGEALVDLGFVSEEQILPFMQRQLNLPATKLREGMIDPLVVRIIPRAKAEAYHALAMFKVRDTLTRRHERSAEPPAGGRPGAGHGLQGAARLRDPRGHRADDPAVLRGRIPGGHGHGRPRRNRRRAAERLGGRGSGLDRVPGGRQPDHQPGQLLHPPSDPPGGQRHPHRAEPALFGRAVPRGRLAAGSAPAAAGHPSGHRLPHQGHGQDGHRRAPPAAGRPLPRGRRGARDRPPRLQPSRPCSARRSCSASSTAAA